LSEVETLYENEKFALLRVPMKMLVVNPYNPNVMDAAQMKALKHSMKKYGYAEFIPVTKVPDDPEFGEDRGKYLVIDGAHRLIAMREEGMGDEDKIEVILVKNITYADAWLGAYTFNKAKGRIKSELVAEMLIRSEANFGLKKTLEMTGLTKEYFDEYTSALKAAIRAREAMESGDTAFGKPVPEVKEKVGETKIEPEFKPVPITDEDMRKTIVADGLKPIIAKPSEEAEVLFVVELPQKQYEFVTKILNMFAEDPKEALVKACEKLAEVLGVSKE